MVNKKMDLELQNSNYFENGYYKQIHIDQKYNLIFVIVGLINVIQIILQIMFSVFTKNYIYFFATVSLGPFQLMAIFLVLCISMYTFYF